MTDAEEDGRHYEYAAGTHDEAGAALEADRLAVLAETHDRGSAKLLTRLGLEPGWRCLEVGAGQGSMARWLAAAVGPTGEVLATDVDLRFVGDEADNLTIRRHDIAGDDLPARHFDLTHARGVLQHVPERERAVANMAAATRPGGWVVVEDIDWLIFDEQQLPEPFGALHRATRAASADGYGYDPFWGRRMLGELVGLGLEDVATRGKVVTMHGGTPSAEWYVMALERGAGHLLESGALDQDTFDAALAQARTPAFTVLGPLEISAWGRVPT